MRDTPIASILLISEDSSRYSPRTGTDLAKRIIRVVDPSTQMQRIQFIPLDPDHPGIIAAHANRWRARKNHAYCQARRELILTIATNVAIANTFVFFHSDGDTAWTQRTASEASEIFDKRIRHGLIEFLAGQRLEDRAIDEMVEKLFLVLPFYSIESWLYQNTGHAIDLCKKHYGGQNVEQFETWQKERELLDEVVKPKESVCLGSRHNSDLAANTYPAEAAYGAKKSFTEFVDRLKSSQAFTKALQQTYS